MEKDEDKYRDTERRGGPRWAPEKYVSVEFCPNSLESIYLFRIRDESASGLGILVREGSEALRHLKVGNVLNIVCRSARPLEYHANLKARVVHATKNDDGQFRGHYLIGLSIIEGQPHESQAKGT